MTFIQMVSRDSFKRYFYREQRKRMQWRQLTKQKQTIKFLFLKLPFLFSFRMISRINVTLAPPKIFKKSLSIINSNFAPMNLPTIPPIRMKSSPLNLWLTSINANIFLAIKSDFLHSYSFQINSISHSCM